MRLDARQRQLIRDEVERDFGADAVVRLFGSRVRDDARGGDIDLLVESPLPVASASWRAALLEARLMRRLEGRRVDVLLAAPNLREHPIHRIARDEGLPL